MRSLSRGERFRAASNLTVSPTYVPDLAHATLDLLLDREAGIVHLVNAGQTTWADLARRAATAAGLDGNLVVDAPAAEIWGPAARPPCSALASQRVWIMPSLQDAVTRWVRECEVRLLDDPVAA